MLTIGTWFDKMLDLTMYWGAIFIEEAHQTLAYTKYFIQASESLNASEFSPRFSQYHGLFRYYIHNLAHFTFSSTQLYHYLKIRYFQDLV